MVAPRLPRQVGVAAGYTGPLRPGPNPKIKSGLHSTRISHTEVFDNVTSNGVDFDCKVYSVNPGCPQCFPWLADIAARYETYKFRSLRFDFIPQNSTSIGGSVMLAFDFNASSVPPDDAFEALSFHDRSADVIWAPSSLQLDLLQGDRLPSRYTRVGLPSGDFDLKNYDLGKLYLCKEGTPIYNGLGRLEVQYDIELFTPQIQDSVGGEWASVSGLDATHLFGTYSASDAQSQLPFSYLDSSHLVFDQAFAGIITCKITGTGLGSNLAAALAPSGYATWVAGPLVNAATTSVIGSLAVKVLKGTTIAFSVTATTVTTAAYFFSRVGYRQVTGA